MLFLTRHLRVPTHSALAATATLTLLCGGAHAATPAPAPPYGLPSRAVTWQGESWRQSGRNTTTVLVRPNARIGEVALHATRLLGTGRVRCVRWTYGGLENGVHHFTLQQQDRQGRASTAADRLALCTTPAPRNATLGESDRVDLALTATPNVQTLIGDVKIALFTSPDNTQGPRVTVITW